MAIALRGGVVGGGGGVGGGGHCHLPGCAIDDMYSIFSTGNCTSVQPVKGYKHHPLTKRILSSGGLGAAWETDWIYEL